jgi:TctA family transporter
MVLLMLSAFQVTHSMGDLIMVVAFTFVGLFMKRFGWPRPPIIIALVLAGPLEKYLWLSVRTYGAEMFLRPQVWAIIAFAIFAVVYTQRVQAGTRAAVGEEV